MALAGNTFAQSTNIAIGTTAVQPSVKRLGVNLGTLTFYDSGQTLQNILNQNPGFEGQTWNSTIRCARGTANSCVDENQWAGWPAGFWNGATYEVFYGAAAGRTGTVISSTAPGNGSGITLTFGDSGAAPANGDYLIVRKTVPGGTVNGWWPATSGAGKISDNLTDLPPGTLGKQTTVLTAPSASDAASMAAYFDSTIGKTFLQLNGTYQVQFKAKGIGGSNQINVSVTRAGVATYLYQTITLTNTWNTYNLTFTAAENGSAIGLPGVVFSTVGADSFELDDASLTQQNGDPTNTTSFRDPVVNALRQLQPGELRYWGGQLGDTLDNLLAPQFGRQLAGYSPWYGAGIDYGLHDFLALCQLVGAEPWFVVPATFSTSDASNLIEYLSGASTTPYGAKRAALGQATPWTQVFPKIHLEFGNEAWNGTFKGGSIEYSEPYGGRAQTIFGIMRANPSYIAANFDLVLGGQASWPSRNTDIQNNCNNNDSFDVAAYTMGTVDNYSDNESLFGSTFAEPEAFMSSTGSTEGLTPGMIYQDYQAVRASSHPVPVSFYETNMGTLGGSITQSALNSYVSSLGSGLMVVDTMLQGMKQFGIVDQNLFALTQYDFNRPDGSKVFMWGAVVDMGVTDRKRPQFLALQLANQALSSGAVMLQTTHTGADPTWNQPLVNTVQLDVAHDLQSYAFAQGTKMSAIVFNFSRTTALPVTFGGLNAPAGAVQMQQLTSTNLTDTNETANLVNIVPSTLTNFNPATGLTLPPYSMTVLTWTGSPAVTPVISAVAASSITGTSAAITWTTNQATSSQVSYGTTTGYGSSSSLNSTLTASHSVTLSGLIPGIAYNYAVTSANSNGNSATSANFTFTTLTQPPAISAISSTNVAATSATITWTTDQASSSLVKYGTTTSYGSLSGLNSTMAISHSMTLTGLTPGTIYNCAVTSANSTGQSATSANLTFKTQAQGPVISTVASSVTGTSATITWTTDQASSSLVNYGTTTGYGSSSGTNPSLVTSHSIILTGLTPGIAYNYAVVSANAAGISTGSANLSFSTVASAPAPQVGYLAFWGITTSGITISWSTDQLATTQLAYGTTSALGQFVPVQTMLSNSHGVVLTGLAPGTTCYFVAQSANASGVVGSSKVYSFTTLGSPASPLPVISAVSASNISAGGATITWTTDQATSSQVQYGATASYASSSATNSTLTTTHSVTLSGLSAGTTYNYAAVSANAAGNIVSSSNFAFSTTALAASAASAPQISYLAEWGVTGTSVAISWSTDAASTTAIAYGTSTALGQTSPVQTALTNSHGVTLTGLTPSTTYYFAAESTGANGGTGVSPQLTFTTLGVGAPTISGFVAVPAPNHAAQVSWTTSVATYSYVAYGTSTAYDRWSTTSPLTSNPQLALGWVPSGVIHCQLVSVDANGNKTVSPDYTFIEP